tara:strand:- start:429 stop:3104 length:2676 start_codon:yes stop_codon:yes gene_type:complete
MDPSGNVNPALPPGQKRTGSEVGSDVETQNVTEGEYPDSVSAAQSAQATNMAISMMTSAGDIAQAQAAGSASETYLANQLQMALSHAPTTETDFDKRYDMMVESERIARGTATTSNDMNQIARDKLEQEMRVAGFDEAQIRNTLNTISVREQAVELERQGIDIKDEGINDAITLITERMDDVDYDEASFGRDIAELNNKIDSVMRQSEELGFQTTDLQSLKMTADALSDAREVLIAFEMEAVGTRAGIETEAVGLEQEGLGLAETYQTAEEAEAEVAGEVGAGRIALAGQELDIKGEGLELEAVFQTAEESAAEAAGEVAGGRIDLAGDELGIKGEGLDISREEVGLEEEGLGIERERLGLAGSGLELSEEEIGLGEEDIATQMERFGLQRESVDRQAMRGEKAAEAEAAGRGASFTTGLRADVENIESARAASIADIGLQEQQLATQLGLSSIERQRLGLGGQEIGLREEELGLQGAGLGLNLERLGLAGDQLGVEQQGLDLSEDELASQRALEESGFEFQTGQRGLTGDVLGVEQQGLDLSADELAAQRAREEAGFEFQTGQRGIEEDELGLTQRSIDQTAAEGMAGLEYQQAEMAAAEADAEVAFGANMRNLGLQDADLSDMAENLNADVGDVRDAISRLDTVRLGHQTEIANLGRELEQSGLDRQQLDLRLQDYGYQRDDIQTALDALDVRRETLASSGEEIDLRDVLVQSQLDTDLNTIAAGRTALAEEQAGYTTGLGQYNEDTATWNAYLAEQSKLDTAAAGQAGAAAYLGAMPWAMEAASDPFFRETLPGNIFDEVGGMYEEHIVSQLPAAGTIPESSIPEGGWEGANWGHPGPTAEADMAGQTMETGPPGTSTYANPAYEGYTQEQINYYENPEVQAFLARLG